MESRSSRRAWQGQVLCLFSFCSWGLSSGQLLRYSVVEESEPGTVVGNLAQDLGLNVAAISERRLRLGYESSRSYFAVNRASGTLTVNEKIDRESLCASSLNCLLPVEVVIENPLELLRLEVEILDVNDNSPRFLTSERIVRITELVATQGARFPLESAQDPDVGTNTVSSYSLNLNPFFSVTVKNRDGKLLPELVLEKALDREDHEKHELILTAFDGGSPARSGTAHITVIVLDINDNAPRFDDSVYRVSLMENVPLNTVLIKLNATDLDDGPNGEIQYAIEDHTSDSIQKLFQIHPHSGEILVQGALDFEETTFYELYIRATDKGIPELEGHCVIQVKIEDVNDNIPEILLTSLVNPIEENTPVGTAVGLLNVRDRDFGENGEVRLHMSPSLPFKFKFFQNHYSLIIEDILDREKVSQYKIELFATDLGSPALQSKMTILLNISDINDNHPVFSQPFYNAHLKENNQPGSLLCTVSASDPDEGVNSYLTYSIAENQIQDSSFSSFVYIDSHNGNIYAQRSFDYELLQILQIPVLVEDAGSPKLRSNVTVYLYILDQNDNSPVILYPSTSREPTTPQKISRSVPINYLINKVTAVDADSGHNAWLSYSLLQATDSSLFRVTQHTGEIRTLRDLQETDLTAQRLLIMVKDNGEPALSTTVTILFSFEDEVYEDNLKSDNFLTHTKEKSHLTQYLIISVVAISIVSFVTFIILSIKCLKNNSSDNSLCCCLSDSQSRNVIKQSNPTLYMNSDGTLKYMEVNMIPKESENQSYRTCFPLDSDQNDFTFMRPLNFPQLRDFVNETSVFLSGNELSESNQQAQPNTDWRFSQAQRPGTSGSQNPEEGGAWPNNQLETERLQAMILASANAGPIEAADGSSTLGGAAGTMGLSTRYGPQFTLQHVPDYRQNVYIPGNTATLTNSAGKRDGKGATSSGGNKKKSGKKEKK
ncbi:protocadherin gamma-C5-like isoform X5 [Rhinatrema bivittatum]|uniref:protocadherin gamma-C5-like isoform X5 n=1 Tax=Rhinatrema bivittatum TaxID=194408 RepID=UPI0011288DE4|nr:protocadherin gamma-C5-like isoform X5 [Rhinatrema bivittatum]